ncbi:hypothetical protein AVEN_263158-1 [Araneus ventricosus]|uniref:Uncharacterized protein n=1 Tax=Araneus ventricosus TaxID=182803 RepID=A0A4Y2FAJ9_ARAVE|nr:hypothetical protein AVEN_263158-1 [Araneus ventricosus]
MNFSGVDRKEVFFFFEEILRSYKQPVYYENLRGHVAKASVNVRKYVLTKCKGDNFLEYFKRRKNYFNVEDGKISLKEEFGNEQLGNSHSNKSKKKNSKGKFVRRSTSFSHSSYVSALKGSDSNKNGEKEYETIAITYFRNRLIRKKKERLWAIEVNDLPKKVKRHLQLYYRNKVKSFLSDYPDKFVIDSDDETVSLAHVSESTNTADSSSADQVSSTNFNQNSANIAVDSEIKKATEYLECVVFFIDILKKLNQPFPLEKLGGYFSQARKEIKDHVKINYRGFKYFFDDAPLIFLKNASEEISLSKEYRKLIKAAENLIKDAKNGLTLPPEMPLKSRINHIFQPQISSWRSSSMLEETDSNNEVLPFEDMANAHEDIIEEMLKFHCSNRRESEISHESTDDFFDNYLMRSTSRESSISLSSRSTRSISVEHSQVEDCSVLKYMEKFGSNTVQGFNEIMENIFLRCIFRVELFCLEFMESEFNYIQNYENKAVEYFMEILDSPSTKLWRLTSLQGSIGNNREIAHFMNKLYKGEKFVSFFEKHPQFEVDPPFVKIALSDKTNCTEDSASFSNEKNVMKDLKDLYELCDFKILLKETYAYLYDVCEFCKGKDEVKVDRLSGILPRFPSCLNMIKSSKGQSLSEKIEHFLRETMIFQFPKKGSIFFPYEIFYKRCQILFAWFEKMGCCDPSLEFVSFSDFLTINVYSRSASNNNRENSNSCINLEECYQNVVDMIEEEIECRSELSYYELPKIIPENILFSLTNGNYYSRPLISALLESGNFRMKDGKISLQKTSEDYNLIPSDNKDNEPTINLSELENHISEEISNGLYIQQNISDNNLVNSSCSPSVNSKDISNHSKAEFCSNQSSKILQTTEYCETKETDSNIVELKSNLSFKGDKMSIDLPLISHGQNENFNSVNENHTSETLKESFLQEESERHMNVLNMEENLFSLTDPENFNPTEETMVCTKTSESVLSSKTSDLVGKESEYVDESSNKYYRCEDEVNSKTDSPLYNSDVLEELSVPFLLPPSESCEFEECPKENQSVSSVSDSTNFLTSKDLSEQGNEFVNDQLLLSHDLSLNTNYIAPLKEKCDISVPSKIKSLDKDSLTKHNTEFEVVSKNGAESNIKVSKVEQNIFLISEDKKSSKFGIALLSKQNSNDSVDVKTEMAKEQQLDNTELPNKDTIIMVFEQSTDKNRNLDNCKASEQIEESFQNDVPQVSDFSDTKAPTRISVPVQDFKKIQKSKEVQVASKNTNISTKHSFTFTPEELFDTSLLKLYLNSENVSEERNPASMTRHDEESVEETAAKEVPFGSSSPMLTSSHNGKSEIDISRTSSCNDLSSEYPMQPISAKVVLLTNSSCIALSDVKKCKKSIYFLKYAFTCDHQDDCSECFSALQIGDEVSCFVPLTEISQKIWIAFMVTKDNSDNLSEFGIFDKLKRNAKAICEGSTKSLSISAQIKSSSHHFGCQTEFPKCDNYSQTDLNGVVDLYKATKETSCQKSLVSVKSVFVQTENSTMTCRQTGFGNAEIPLSRKCAESLTYLNGDFEKDAVSENATCQDSWHREITRLTKNVSCQTFSTGQIMMLKHHPM